MICVLATVIGLGRVGDTGCASRQLISCSGNGLVCFSRREFGWLVAREFNLRGTEASYGMSRDGETEMSNKEVAVHRVAKALRRDLWAKGCCRSILLYVTRDRDAVAKGLGWY